MHCRVERRCRIALGGTGRRTLLAELFQQGINVVSDVICLGLRVRHHLVPVLASFADGARSCVASHQVACLLGEALNLIRDPSPGVWTSFRGKDHPEREANGSARDGTPDPYLRSVPLCFRAHEPWFVNDRKPNDFTSGVKV